VSDWEYDVFLSHSSKDKVRARSIAERLRRDGLKVWFDDWIIRPGDDIYLKLEEGLNSSRFLVLLMSANSLGAEWPTFERHIHQFSDPLNRERSFLPVLLEDYTLPKTLRVFRHVDLRQESEAAYGELLSACRAPALQGPQPPAGPEGAKARRAHRFPRLARPSYLRGEG
jgi:TIR domain